MSAREMEIEIGPDGTVRARISGVKGPGCKQYAQLLSETLGIEVSFEPTSEFFEPEVERDVDIDERGWS